MKKRKNIQNTNIRSLKNADLPIRSSSELRALRYRTLYNAAVKSESRYVLYWMQQARRLQDNHAFDKALELAEKEQCGLVIVEDILCEQEWNGARHMAFALEGMLNQRDDLDKTLIHYVPLIARTEKELWDSLGLALEHAVGFVTDDAPVSIAEELNEKVMSLLEKHNCPGIAVDTNGLMPMALLVAPVPSAAVFRRYVHKHMPAALQEFPQEIPLKSQIVKSLKKVSLSKDFLAVARAGLKDLDAFEKDPEVFMADLPLDHGVPRIARQGGAKRALKKLKIFLTNKLDRYEERNNVQVQAVSSLSPELHWGHISPWQMLRAIFKREKITDWTDLVDRNNIAKREGFWCLPLPIQMFLDQVLVWREIGYHSAHLDKNYTTYEGLPEWAKSSLADHVADPRPDVYSLEELETAQTHDQLWNAAQNELRETGLIHNYLRMNWGKCVLAWQQDPRKAFEFLVYLNNRWALDGRNPNTYCGITWCFGRFDRPWMKRDIYGVIRYMTTASTRKKIPLQDYIDRYAGLSDENGNKAVQQSLL